MRSKSDVARVAEELLKALERVCEQAESWHRETGHEDDDPIVKCDGICACIPQMKAAIANARRILPRRQKQPS